MYFNKPPKYISICGTGILSKVTGEVLLPSKQYTCRTSMQPPLSVFSFRLKNEVGDSLISPMDNYSNKMADFIFFFIIRTHFSVSPLNQYLQQHADGMYHKSRFWTLPNIYIHIYIYVF